MSGMTDVEITERLAHIEQMQADRDRKRQEIMMAPWALVLTSLTGGITAGAALMAAAVALVRLFP